MLFAGPGDVTSRKTMGGARLDQAGAVFGILHTDKYLHLKRAGPMRARPGAMGCARWTYARPQAGRETRMPCRRLPDPALDDPAEAAAMARAALAHP
ncbi:TfoX/Sxy family protein [Roseovarius salinarum]|uniref:TfoX/Sxy family protein n=1 Tax=Roseovarius salinarum TaxID=1981892 RepID=UPI0022B80185|nr:TfoX/Sxy family protein [Roseovarius salinarum]